MKKNVGAKIQKKEKSEKFYVNLRFQLGNNNDNGISIWVSNIKAIIKAERKGERNKKRRYGETNVNWMNFPLFISSHSIQFMPDLIDSSPLHYTIQYYITLYYTTLLSTPLYPLPLSQYPCILSHPTPSHFTSSLFWI